MERVLKRSIVELLTILYLPVLVAGCSDPTTTAIPTAPIQFETEVKEPDPTSEPSKPVVAPLPTEAVPQSEVETAPNLTLVSGDLATLAKGENLELLAEIPIPRVDFGVRVAFSTDEETLLHSGTGLQIQLFDLAASHSNSEITGFENYSPITISQSPDGNSIVADDGPLIRVWNSDGGAPEHTLELSPISTIISAGFQGEGVYFAVDYHGNVGLWDARSWGEISRFSFPGRIDMGLLFPDGKSVALQDRDRNEIAILNLAGERISGIPLVDENPVMLSVSPQGDRILLQVNRGFASEGIKIVSISSGEPQLTLPLTNYRYFAVSHNWDLLAAMDVFNRLRLYKLPEGELMLEQELDLSRTLGIELSPGANYLAVYAHKSAGEGGAIQVWGRSASEMIKNGTN